MRLVDLPPLRWLAGLAAVQGVINALASNQRQLQHNLEQAAARLPFAHLAGGGLSKVGDTQMAGVPPD